MSKLIEYKHETPLEFIRVIGRMARNGQLQAHSVLKEISDMTKVWLKEEKTRNDLNKMFPGQEIHTLDIVDEE